MAKKYRVDFGVRFSNLMVSALLRLGVPLGGMMFITVRGRKSGIPRSTPIVVGQHAGKRFIIAPFGDVQWVRNLRAAGEATLSRGSMTEPFQAEELAPAEAAPLMRSIFGSLPGFIRSYFDVTTNSSLEDFIAEAPRHPVFMIHPLAKATL